MRHEPNAAPRSPSSTPASTYRTLFGPGRDKEFFYLFDYCQNLEYFSQDIAAADGAAAEVLSKRLFKRRLELIGELDQIDFVDLIVDHLTEYGSIDPARLYESPFTDVAARGPEGLFSGAEVEQLLSVLARVRASAEASTDAA
jgi:type I site-specific restriction endonuclease